MTEKKFNVGVKAIVRDGKGRILLLKRKARKGSHPAFWDLPGGRIEEGSTPEETLKKEIREELGSSHVTVLEKFHAAIANTEVMSGGKKYGLVLFAYLCNLHDFDGKKIKLSKEHTEYRWVSVKDAKKFLRKKYPEDFIEELSLLEGHRRFF